MDRLKAMANFVRIVECGSLSAAANASGQAVASLVRSLAALEQHLGVRLLNRSTRRMALTSEGEQYLAFSRRTLAEFDDIEQQLGAHDGAPRGLLRVGAPVEFGQRFVAPLVNEYLKAHPGIRVELSLNDQVVALLDERLDCALRIGHLPDSGMVARALGATRLVTCASPAYLRASAPLPTPAALAEHACISQVSHGLQWHFRQAGKDLAQPIAPRLVCNQIRAARLACEQGLGVTRLLHYQVADALAEGSLVRVLRDYEPPNLPVQWVYPHALALAPRVRGFVEWAYPLLERVIPAVDQG
ncbi:LysR substrate-binding domain-containing protein [Pseudomonas sp. NPDC007930]|uniref:LysR family transcriptional regulator n=1 Tax=Pseudomonas sp. NPDC007930 TaxID=3364417 RepID=UPI0036EF0F0B